MPARKYTEQQRLAFMALIDRGGSVRAAAIAVGVHPDAGYKWMKQAGLSTPRSTQRRYSAEEKALFFRRLAEGGNISSVARELGFNRVTCYVWAHKAGIFAAEYADANRQEFLRLRREGLSRRVATARLGIESHQASDWDKGIRVFSKGRVYPDGRVVLYRPAEILANVKNRRTAWVQGERVSLAKVEQVIDPRYLSLIERERLKDLLMTSASIRKIAVTMGRSPSTISRELRRNTVSKGGYLPHTAHRTSVKRRERVRVAKLASAGPLRDYVAAKLKKRWSPEQISHRLRRDFPHDPGMRVSPETIYQAIYVHAHGELKRELAASLRRGRKRRKPHRDPEARTSRFTDPMTPLTDRPAEVEDRALPGHWEGDLILGAGNGSAVATVVERATRYVVLGHLPIERTAEAVRDSLVTALVGLPVGLRRTLTWDQGAEMSEHKAFAVATDMAVYFCDPASPWQRGTNENTNGLLRQYLPKRTDLRAHSAHDLAAIAEELNARPRKILDWDTPAERMTALLNTT
ncbi:IS30 family transposase [Demequina lutea]|uniref:IS30 family transposase n=1 Tax=Demequina lutea TaxID=431489 RepID=A0A7Z0CGH8_9MICO|nr:IS30 family transposase [Demequina lutea]